MTVEKKDGPQKEEKVEEEKLKLFPCKELENKHFVGLDKVVGVLQDKEGNIYIKAEKDKFRHKMTLEAAKLILSEKENPSLEGEDITTARLVSTANCLYILMREEYDLKVSEVDKMTQIIENIYTDEETTKRATEIVAFLRDKYDVGVNEVKSVMTYLQNAVFNDLNLATRAVWGKSKYSLTLQDVMGTIKKADDEELTQAQQDVKDEKIKKLKKDMGVDNIPEQV